MNKKCEHFMGPFSVCKNATFRSDVKIGGNLTVKKKLIVKKDAKIVGDLHIQGDTINDGTYTIANNTNSNGPDSGALVVEGGSGIGGDLNVGGDSNIVGNFEVGGNSIVVGNSDIGGNVSVIGNSNVVGNSDVGGNLNVDGNVSTGQRFIQQGSILMPVGSLMPFAGSSPPPGGYLLCDGSSVSRTVYSDLFAVIGTSYGVGDGSTTFNLPDLRGRVIIGTSVSFPFATTGGNTSTTLSVGNLPAHTHTGITNVDGIHNHSINDPGHIHGQQNGLDDGNISNTPGQAPPGDGAPNTAGFPTDSATTGITINAGGGHSHGFTTDPTGSNTPFSLMNPYLSMSYIIKT